MTWLRGLAWRAVMLAATPYGWWIDWRGRRCGEVDFGDEGPLGCLWSNQLCEYPNYHGCATRLGRDADA